MIQSKKAIGFFYGVGFLTFSFLLFKTINVVSFSDFALFEWQLKQIIQGSLELPYQFLKSDPSLEFYPLPNVFFHLSGTKITSTFPNLYPILFSPIYVLLGKIGIQITQFVLFFLSIWMFYQIKRDHLSTVLLLFGSSIPIYIGLVHDTILIFFLEICIFYCLHKKLIPLASVLSVSLVWIRPEVVFVFCLFPFYFEWKQIWKQFFLWSALFGISFVCVNYISFGTVFPLRLVKNSTFVWKPEVILYLFRLLLEQIPIFTLFILLCLLRSFEKRVSVHSLLLLFITCLILILSPNTGGHNTPRYLYFLVPFYLFSIQLILKENYISEKLWTFVLSMIILFSLYQFNSQTKELIKISKFQSNTLLALAKIPNDTLVFNNSDFSFVALPLLEQNKNLVLLRKNPDESQLSSFLSKNQIDSFVFVELPPSTIPIPNPLIIPNCKSNCQYNGIKTDPLPNAMLPIVTTSYSRSNDSETNF
ncbi:LA_3751/LA_3752 family putative glycosyltransferase [Leptospira bouyouniensis]|uniref:Dolichyl-phosphate-mannose-protein mannosyltransferase n=1 Tax=Leptospira bouyouniensis TaxID=2484911 RepID=A0ABY2L7S8_9LEPT|nr:hypothetical protein [Leptospira bouyouniensis]TGK52711.1 hypothetical protein EHQ10_02870 [Leptospira bouyouniensis]